MSGIVLVIQPSFIFHQVCFELKNVENWKSKLSYFLKERGDGYNDLFLIASIVLIVTTILNSVCSIILRKLRKIHVASLTSSREIIFVIITFLVLSFANIDIYHTNYEEKLKILFLGNMSYINS